MNDNEQDIIQETRSEEVEGLDTSQSSGWGDEYPIDAVFVREDHRTVNEIMGRIDKGRYVLDPEFQRDFVWPATKQSRLIESCLMRIPLPVFYVAEADDGTVVVIDGLQRLTTFHRYLNNMFALTGPGKRADDAGGDEPFLNKKFKDLPVNLQERLEDTQLTFYILDAKAPERAKLDIFERVNGGVPLSRQQMRNCLFSGQATQWLKKAAESDLFMQVTGGTLDRKLMRDREAINRFCAFRLLGVDQYKGDMEEFLAQALEKMNRLEEEELEALRNAFRRAMHANKALFGKHAFRKSLALRDKFAARTVINIAFFDVCSTFFADFEEDEIDANAEPLTSCVCNLFNNDQFIQAITYGTNAPAQVRTRFEAMKEAIAEVITEHADTDKSTEF